MDVPDPLRALLAAVGPSGHEQAAARTWREAAAGFARVSGDSLGSSYARVGPPGAAASLAIVGHIDEIVDIGVSSREQALERVRPGDAGVWHGDLLSLGGGRIASRALDNRLGAYAALEAARRLGTDGALEVEVVAVAAVQEEIGGYSGSAAAAYALEPTVALAVDVTYATDVPGGNPRRAGSVELGSGAAITRSPVVNPQVFELLVETAEREGIPHTIEVYAGRTHTDADALRVARGGVPTGLVSIPLRYMHSPCELASLDDLEAVVSLLVGFARRLRPELSFAR